MSRGGRENRVKVFCDAWIRSSISWGQDLGYLLRLDRCDQPGPADSPRKSQRVNMSGSARHIYGPCCGYPVVELKAARESRYAAGVAVSP